MKKILVVQSSARQEGSLTREYTAQLVRQIEAANPGSWVVTRDLGAEPVPHLDATLLGGWMKPAEEQTEAEKAASALSNQLVDELLASDIVVIGSSMYNFGITSTLKAWFDHVLRAGRTFKYTEAGPVGLTPDRKVYVVTARGGRYEGSPLDFQEPYVRQLLGFIGITDVEFVNVEGQSMGPEEAAKGRAEADEVLAALA
ncbi:FMN-dependent NADH-azoreductase [Halopseudomonas maritima]|uniref:FMN-dependent NADH-azoreductase n=1 Tax=Halopseudomonas maritima TaxID=2918528 RepID=UPI001EEA92DA|nr:FMN-dependent NADH-azoreductase [Halopseudomonas maritima]UJJ31871.1 FMN-dependent NADH-azoreductase [Halopseudomonas maritima]